MFTINYTWGHRSWSNPWYTRITLLVCVILGLIHISTWYGSFVRSEPMCPECQHSAWSTGKAQWLLSKKVEWIFILQMDKLRPREMRNDLPKLTQLERDRRRKLWNLFCPTFKSTFCFWTAFYSAYPWMAAIIPWMESLQYLQNAADVCERLRHELGLLLKVAVNLLKMLLFLLICF